MARDHFTDSTSSSLWSRDASAGRENNPPAPRIRTDPRRTCELRASFGPTRVSTRGRRDERRRRRGYRIRDLSQLTFYRGRDCRACGASTFARDYFSKPVPVVRSDVPSARAILKTRVRHLFTRPKHDRAMAGAMR